MTRRMRTSKAGLELIKSFEGFRARAVALPGGRWTIGHGHTQTARENLRITRADAEAVLREYDLPPIEQTVSEAVLAPLNQNEFDALVSFVFNIGEPAFMRSHMLARLNGGQPLAAAEAMSNWRKAHVNGRLIVVDALVRRRMTEQALFVKPPSGQPVVPSTLFRPISVTQQAIKNTPETGASKTDAAFVKPALITPAVKTKETDKPAMTEAVSSGRLTRELSAARPDTATPKASVDDLSSNGPTPDEITRAISALANPDENNVLELGAAQPLKPDDAVVARPEITAPPFDRNVDDTNGEDLPMLPGIAYGEAVEDVDSKAPKPNGAKLIDDLEPVDVDPVLLEQAVADAENGYKRARPSRGLHMVTGLIGVALGAFGIFRLRSGPNATTLQGADLELHLSRGAIALGVFLVLLALYLAFRPRQPKS